MFIFTYYDHDYDYDYINYKGKLSYIVPGLVSM